jgi:hypothetical protein
MQVLAPYSPMSPQSVRALILSLGLSFGLLAGLGSAQAYEQCQLPEAPAIADNLGASEAELLKVQKLVKEFVAKVDGYLACSEREQAKAQALALRSSLPFSKGEQDIWNQRYNEGIDAQTRVADQFNAQVKIWRARQADAGTAKK